MKPNNPEKFPLWRFTGDVKEALTRQPNKWIQYGYQKVRFVDGQVEIQSMIIGERANPFVLR